MFEGMNDEQAAWEVNTLSNEEVINILTSKPIYDSFVAALEKYASEPIGDVAWAAISRCRRIASSAKSRYGY